MRKCYYCWANVCDNVHYMLISSYTLSQNTCRNCARSHKINDNVVRDMSAYDVTARGNIKAVDVEFY
jgi:hypothetical protein